MKILRIIKNPGETTEAEHAALRRLHVDVVDLSPTLLSAFTAMTIAKAADTHKSRVVIVERVTDAIAAISAKRIVKDGDLRVVFAARPNDDPPRHMPKEVTANIDLWLFSSERQINIYPIVTTNRYVVPPVSDIDADTLADLQVHSDNPKPVLAWIGQITDGERLKKVIEKIDELDGRFLLRISGAGKARDVMPAVKFSRTLRHVANITWVGEEYVKNDEIKRCDAAVRTADDITVTETEISMSGRPLLTIDQIEPWLNSLSQGSEQPHKSSPINTQNYDRALRTALSTIIFID